MIDTLDELPGRLTVVRGETGPMYQLEIAGKKLRAHSGRRLLEMYREQRMAHGLTVPPAL